MTRQVKTITEGSNSGATVQPMLSDAAATLDAANVAALAFIGFQERITEITDALDEREVELDEREAKFELRVQNLEGDVDTLRVDVRTLQADVDNLSDQTAGADNEDIMRPGPV